MFIIHILKKHCNCNNISGILLGLNKDLPRLEGQKYEQGKFQKMCSLQRKKMAYTYVFTYCVTAILTDVAVLCSDLVAMAAINHGQFLCKHDHMST